MRLCDLTDEQLQQHAANHRKIGTWLGASEVVSRTMNGIADAIVELIDRRAAMAHDLTEKSFAYERAASVIEVHCTPVDDEGESFDPFWDLDSADRDIDDEIAYLESRRLLMHHPENARWVVICDEGEPL